MEHMAEHNTGPDRPEELRPSLKSPEQAENTAPARGVPRPLFIAVAALAALLAVLLGWLALCTRDSARYEFNLTSQLERQEASALLLREELDQTKTALTQAQDQLARRETELAQAQDAIDTLKEYSLAAPDGTVPEYTQLYPDFYAPEWEGEAAAGEKVCCLTFDDGPSANTGRVLETLDRYGVKATFFVVGGSASTAAGQEWLKRIAAAGHTIGMHSWSHDYRKVYASVESFLEEFSRLYQLIYETTGARPSVYRFPGGSINGYNRGVYQEIIAEMTRRGFVYYDWNASAQDATVRPRPGADIAADCLKGVGRPLAVVLCHDSAARGTTADALPAVIQGYQGAGYVFSPLHPGVRPITFGYPKPK